MSYIAYVSIKNSFNWEVKDIIIKAEVQMERQRILLLDTWKSPIELIRLGGHYDFLVKCDLKELGAHTVVCTALYNDGDGECKYLPQFFKLIVANPLSVWQKFLWLVKLYMWMLAFKIIQNQTFLKAKLTLSPRNIGAKQY